MILGNLAGAPTDAATLIRGLTQAVSDAPFLLAPERAKELSEAVFAGAPFNLIFEEGKANLEAFVEDEKVVATYPALLSLWAVAYAAVLICDEASLRQSAFSAIHGENPPDDAHIELPRDPGTPMHVALALVDSAKELIRDPSARWTPGLPEPQSAPVEKSLDWRVNNLFLAAAAWAILHEIGHVNLHHGHSLFPEKLKAREYEADEWAVGWALKSAPGFQFEFRLLAIGVGYVWLALIDEKRRESPTHPPAFDRLARRMQEGFGETKLSAGLQASAYVIKACFIPFEEAPVYETAQDMFVDTLVRASRAAP